MTRAACIFTYLFASSVALAAPGSAAPSSHMSYTERYGVLSDRNIFLRDRSHPTTRPTGPSSAGSSSSNTISRSDPEHSIVVRGIVFEDHAYHAYIENSASGVVTRLSEGDPIARGKVSEIAARRPHL